MKVSHQLLLAACVWIAACQPVPEPPAGQMAGSPPAPAVPQLSPAAPPPAFRAPSAPVAGRAAVPAQPVSGPASAPAPQPFQETAAPSPALTDRVYVSSETPSSFVGAPASHAAVAHIRKSSPPQTVIVRTEQPAWIQTASGATVAVPADAFRYADTGEPVRGPVKVQISEAVSLRQMVASGVHTATADGQLLVSAGMYRISATAGGRELALNTGKALTIQVPAADADTAMQLFAPAHQPSGEIAWVSINHSAFKLLFRKQTVQRILPGVYVMPDGRRFELDTLNSWTRDLTYSYTRGKYPKLVARVAAIDGVMTPVPPAPEHYRQLNGVPIAGAVRYQSRVGVKYWANESVRDPYYRKILLQDIVRDSVPMTFKAQVSVDKHLRGSSIAYAYPRPIRMAIYEAVKAYPWSASGRYQVEYHVYAHRRHADEVTGKFDRTRFAFMPDYRFDPDEKGFVARSWDRALSENSQTFQPKAEYYEIEMPALGWINLDRFLKLEVPKTELLVQGGRDESVFLIFKDMKSMLNGSAYFTGDGFRFTSLPEGTQLAVLGLKRVDDQDLYAWQDLTLTGPETLSLTYLPYDQQALDARMNQVTAGERWAAR